MLIPIAYFLVGAALYASTLDIFFMSDDFEFLKIVAPAQGVSVVFEPLVGIFAAVLVGTQAKELWVVFPGLIVAHILAFGVPGDRTARGRALIAVAGTSAH